MRAKFKYDRKEVVTYPHGEYTTLIMGPVTGNSEENKSFWNATPSGELKINIANKKAIEFFELGKEYYLDFTKAE